MSRRPDLQEPFEPWRIIRLSQLSPGQRVRYFYLSILRRAARAGHARGPQQTPYEYGQALAGRLPEAASEVTTLTQAFVEARYSQRVLDDQEANAIKKVWWRARAFFMRRRRSGE